MAPESMSVARESSFIKPLDDDFSKTLATEYAKPTARETTAANTVLAAPSPDRHQPGTRRYLAEIGLLRSP